MAGKSKKNDPGMTEEQVMKLFDERNEMKRKLDQALAQIESKDDEVAAMRKKTEGQQERFEGLEAMLADPEVAQNAVVYYRLDALWKYCRHELETTAAAMKAELEKQESDALLKEFESRQSEHLTNVRAKANQISEVIVELKNHIDEVEKQIASLTKIWHFFKKRNLTKELAGLREDLKPVQEKYDTTHAELAKIEAKEAPQYKGLSVAAKRRINIHLISVAQYFYVHFMEGDISGMALSTQNKPPHEINFGSRQECLDLEGPIDGAVDRLKNDAERESKVSRRDEYLQERLKFAGDSDTVPERGLQKVILSLGGDSGGMDATEVSCDVVEQNYWDLGDILFK